MSLNFHGSQKSKIGTRDRKKKIKTFITGISGFVGGHLADFLLTQGCEVSGQYRSQKPCFSKNIKVFPVEITDTRSLSKVLRKVRPDVIFHLAAQSIPRAAWQDPIGTISVNTGGTVSLMNAMLKATLTSRLVFASTNLVYGKNLRLLHKVGEDTSILPEDPYAFSKALAELSCLNYHARYAIDVVIARPFIHIGPRQSDKLLFSDWCKQIALIEKKFAKPLLRVGNLDAFRDILNVSDVVNAYYILARKGKSGQIYNICTGKTAGLKQLADSLLMASTKPAKIFVEKKRVRKTDPPKICGDNRKILRLGWVPKSDAINALNQMLDYWRKIV